MENSYDPRFYDIDFSTDISNRMQIPDRIGVKQESTSRLSMLSPSTIEAMGSNGHFDGREHSSMAVPERILLAGQEQIIESRHEPAMNGFSNEFSLSSPAHSLQLSEQLETPPRTLTLSQAQYPDVEAFQLHREEERALQSREVTRPTTMSSGRRPQRFSQNDDSVDDEERADSPDKPHTVSKLLRKMQRMHRRVDSLEEAQERRQQRELVLYPVVASYFFLKVLAWLWRKL